jgi:hypothetical protein
LRAASSPHWKVEFWHGRNSRALGLKGVPGQFKKNVSALLARRIIAYTVPEKPGSRLQKYRLVKSAKAR